MQVNKANTLRDFNDEPAEWRPLDIDCGELHPSTGGLILAREELRNHVRTLSSLSNVRALLAIVRQWGIISLSIGLAIFIGHWAAYLLAFIIIASRQHALGVLMHEASHYRLLSNRILNDWIGDLFLALPLMMSLNRWRFEHLRHHRFTNTNKDPYWCDFQADKVWAWPKKPSEATWILIRDIVGLNIPSIIKAGRRWSPFPEHFSKRGLLLPLRAVDRVRMYLFIIILAAVLWVTHGWEILAFLWILPLLTLGFSFIRIRTIGEHLGLPGRHELDSTRHIDGTWIEKLCICPLNINYHIAHHLFPSVPYYKLPELQRLLMKNDRFKNTAYMKSSYLGLKKGTLGEVLLLA